MGGSGFVLRAAFPPAWTSWRKTSEPFSWIASVRRRSFGTRSSRCAPSSFLDPRLFCPST
jgi:hypothetical protein